jgi:2-iminobutanoate/2-iminopropanoate deaminase
VAQRSQAYHFNEAMERQFGYAQAVRAGNFLFVSGTAALDETFTPAETDNEEGQYRMIYEQLKETLRAHGLSFSNVVKETVFARDLDSFIEVGNAVRKQYYADCYFPALTAVELARVALAGNVVEVDLIAAFPEKG